MVELHTWLPSVSTSLRRRRDLGCEASLVRPSGKGWIIGGLWMRRNAFNYIAYCILCNNIEDEPWRWCSTNHTSPVHRRFACATIRILKYPSTPSKRPCFPRGRLGCGLHSCCYKGVSDSCHEKIWGVPASSSPSIPVTLDQAQPAVTQTIIPRSAPVLSHRPAVALGHCH